MSTLFRNQSQGWWVLRDIIAANQEFHNSTKNFRGEHWDADNAKLPNKGWMPQADYNTLERRHKLSGINYVVWSYQTVIAYRTCDGVWHVPSAKYSKATSRQQGQIMTVVSVLGDQAA